MSNNILFKKENLFIVLIFSFSLLINQYYGNKGVFPVDSFSHFDTGFRILLGEHPFKNYWIVSGPLVDYIQAIFFYFFGVTWQSYLLHASLFNALISVATFAFLRSFKLSAYYSLIYSLLFSILAYPTSGTPFVDHHSAFFSLLGIYALILAIKTEKILHWLLVPFLFGFAFLSKQVPSSYIIISVILTLSIFLIVNKRYYWIKYIFLSSIIFIFLLFLFGAIQGISLSSFLDQYIFYPQSIGSERINNFTFTFRGVFGHFKFIYISLIPLLYINIKKIIFYKNYFKEKDLYYFLILILYTFSLIFHQILTKNQTFIFFLIPILLAYSHVCLNLNNATLSKGINILMLLICIFATTKYHIRFNEGRKFHELSNTNFKLTSDAKKIDKKFRGLKWITPAFNENPNEEIILINEVKNYLTKDNRTKMVMTNYSFFSAILEKKLFSTTRWHTFDGSDYPQKKNKYFVRYKDLFINTLKSNNIEVIYTIKPVNQSNIYDYIAKNCFDEKEITKILKKFELKKCREINK